MTLEEMTLETLLSMPVGMEIEFGAYPDSYDIVRESETVWRFITDWSYTKYSAEALLAQAKEWDAQPRLEPAPRLSGRGRAAFLKYKEERAAWKIRNNIK